MTSPSFDASQLLRAAEQLLNGREFFLTTVLSRLNEAASAFPHDGAIRTAQRVIENKVKKGGSLATISQAEFQGIYDDVCGLGNKVAFREALGDLLLNKEFIQTAHENDSFARSLRGDETEVSIVNQDEVEKLAGLFDETSGPAKGSFVDNGRKGVELELEGMGFPSPNVEVAAKNDKFVLYVAGIDTNKGRISTLIPAEIKMGTVLMPSVFIGEDGFEGLTKENIGRYAQNAALTGKTHNPALILELMTEADAGIDRGFKVEATENRGYYKNLGEISSDFFATSPVKTPASIEHLTDSMVRDALAEAGLSYPPQIVALAKAAVSEELSDFGVQCGKVVVASEFDGGLTLAATIYGTGGTKTIQIPVEIVNNKPLMPSVFTSGVVAQPFEKDALHKFAGSRTDGTFSAMYTDKFGMPFKDLHKFALKNAAYGNFVEVEETLAVIAERFGDSFHKIAFDDLMGLLNAGFAKEEKPLDTMERYIKEANEQAKTKEANIKMSSNFMYLNPED